MSDALTIARAELAREQQGIQAERDKLEEKVAARMAEVAGLESWLADSRKRAEARNNFV